MTLNLSVYRVSVQRRRILNCVFRSTLHVSDSRSDRQSACQERLAVMQQCRSAGDLASLTDSALSQPLLVCQLAVDRASLTHSAPSSPLLVCVFLCRRRWTLRCDQRFLGFLVHVKLWNAACDGPHWSQEFHVELLLWRNHLECDEGATERILQLNVLFVRSSRYGGRRCWLC